MLKRFCKMFSESSPGRWAVLRLLCCPSKPGELSENIFPNLFHSLTPQTVSFFHQSSEEYLENFSTMKSYALEEDYIMQLRRSSVHEITLGFGTMLSRLCNVMRCSADHIQTTDERPRTRSERARTSRTRACNSRARASEVEVARFLKKKEL